MKKLLLSLALLLPFVSAKADIIMSNMVDTGVTSSKANANIWFKLAQPQNGLFNTLNLYGQSGQTVSLSLNIYQWLGGGLILPESASVNGLEKSLGGGSSAYAFTVPTSLQNLAANPNGTAFGIGSINATGTGFYQSNNSSTSGTVVNSAYASIISPGGQQGATWQQFQGANYQFAFEKVAAVPEPSSYVLGFAGLLGMVGFASSRKKKAKAAVAV